MKLLQAYDQYDYYTSVLAIMKRGTFASAKQYRYLRDKFATSTTADVLIFTGLEAPAGTEFAIYCETMITHKNGVHFGRKARRRAGIAWVNSGGVLRLDRVKFKYDDMNGFSMPDGVEVGAFTPREPNPEVAELDAREVARKQAIEELAERAKAIAIPEGRQTIQGTVKSLRSTTYNIPGAWNKSVTKMTLVREDGVTYYGSAPMGLHPQVGDIVALCATVTVKEPGFAYFSRPTKAGIIQEAGQKVT